MIGVQNLSKLHEALKCQFQAQLAYCLDTSQFIGGRYVDEFERQFAIDAEATYAVSCANGTDALEIAVRALDLQAGDKVIVPAMTWISTASAVVLAGGTPIFCDIDRHTGLIDLELAITLAKKHKAVGVIVVHLGGVGVDVPALKLEADAHNFWIIEDCAQSHLGRYPDGKAVGSAAALACYSFYPGKNLGALGDAGAVTTMDQDLAIKVRRLARHGGLVKHEHQIIGRNSRLDSLQASFLIIKLKHIEDWTAKRKRIAIKYAEAFKGKLEFLDSERTGNSVWHVFPIFVDDPVRIQQILRIKYQVETLRNYPKPLHQLPCFSGFVPEDTLLPNSEQWAKQVLCLPMCPTLTVQELDYVSSSVIEILQY